MKTKLGIFIFFVIVASLFQLLSQPASAAPLCAYDQPDKPYTIVDYRCNPDVYAPQNCVRSTRPGYGNCDQFNASGQCGFCGVPNETCSAVYVNQEGGYYRCTITKQYEPRGSYCTSSRWIGCGPTTQEPVCKTIDCTNKCGLVSRECNNKFTDCGKCGSGYTCNSSNRCVQTNTCDPYPGSQSECGNNYMCGQQNNGCDGTFNCGNTCSNGYSCQGQNANGLNGTCKKNPTPTPSQCDPDPGNITECGINDKCDTWNNGCGGTFNCGGCKSGYSCKGKNENDRNGTCTKNPTPTPPPPGPTCIPNPAKIEDCGINDKCEIWNDGCSGIFDCRGCSSGYTCKGKNANGRNGTCQKNPTPTPGTATPIPTSSNRITGMVFYDKITSTNRRGTEPGYGVCFPAGDAQGTSGARSGNVSLTVENANGNKIENYTATSYKNCTRNGNTGSGKGFILNSNINCKSVKYDVPTGYEATGYNYQVGSGGTTVVTTGQLDRTPVLCGNITVRFGYQKVTTTTSAKVGGIVFIDNNGNNQYDPGEESDSNPEGNNEVCYNGNTTINVGTSAKTFTSTTNCNSFSFNKGNGTENVSLGNINKYYIKGLSYKDATHPNWTFVEDVSSIPINGSGEVRFAVRPAPSTFSILTPPLVKVLKR